MRYFTLFALAVLLIGCGAAASQVQPEEPEAATASTPIRYKSECLEVTTPPEWRVTKAETVRPTPEEIADGEDVFSGLALTKGPDQDITIIYPHNGPAVADGMLLSSYVSLVMTLSAVRENPEQALADGIAEYDVSALEEIYGHPDSRYFVVRMVEVADDGSRQTVMGWFAVYQIDPADENTSVYFNTTVAPVGNEVISSEVMEIVNSLRLTCID